MRIKDRLKLAFDAKSLKLVAVCEISGIPYSTLQNYLRDVREPTVENLIKLSTHLNINLHWLLTGQGEMFINEVVDDLTQEEASLIDDFRHMNDQGKAAVTTSARAMAQQELFKKNKVS